MAGGSTLTLSDVSTAAGRLDGFGDRANVEDLSADTVDAAIAWVDEQVSILADRLKSSNDAVPLIAVGGGAHLVAPSVPGISEVIRPNHHDVANAYGASIAEASGSVDLVYSYDDGGRESCLEDAKNKAIEKAVAAGAESDNSRITSVVEVPMSYVPGGGCRVIVKAVGPVREN